MSTTLSRSESQRCPGYTCRVQLGSLGRNFTNIIQLGSKLVSGRFALVTPVEWLERCSGPHPSPTWFLLPDYYGGC
jgi:hypothetical protein